MLIKLPRKMQLGALRSALSAKLRDGELKVVSEFSLGEAKTKLMRQTLDTLEINRTVLLVDNADNRNLQLSSRNLEGVKLVASRDVNVYDLLGHEQVLLTRGGGEETFGGAWRNELVYDVIKRPTRDRKRRHQEGRRAHAVLRSRRRTPTRPRSSRRSRPLFKVKVADVRTSTTAGKLRRRGRFAGYRVGLEKSLRAAEGRRKDAGVRGDS